MPHPSHAPHPALASSTCVARLFPPRPSPEALGHATQNPLGRGHTILTGTRAHNTQTTPHRTQTAQHPRQVWHVPDRCVTSPTGVPATVCGTSLRYEGRGGLGVRCPTTHIAKGNNTSPTTPIAGSSGARGTQKLWGAGTQNPGGATKNIRSLIHSAVSSSTRWICNTKGGRSSVIVFQTTSRFTLT